MKSDGTVRPRSRSTFVTGRAQGSDCPEGCLSLPVGCSACRARWVQLARRSGELAEDEPDEQGWPRLSGLEESALLLHLKGDDEQTLRTKLGLAADVSFELPDGQEAEVLVLDELTRAAEQEGLATSS